MRGFGDFAIGISLSLGLFTRLGGMLAILRAVTNILVAGGAGPDTVRFNAMLIAAGAIALTTGVDRRFGPRLITLGPMGDRQTLAVSGRRLGNHQPKGRADEWRSEGKLMSIL